MKTAGIGRDAGDLRPFRFSAMRGFAALSLGLVVLISWEGAFCQSETDFSFEVQNASGYQDETITTHVLFSSTGSCKVQGWQFALYYPVGLLELIEARCGDVVQVARNGSAADYCEVQHYPEVGGVTIGVVIDFQAQHALPPGNAYDTMALSFKLLGPCPSEAPIQFIDWLGDPPILPIVTCEGKAFIPANLQSGTIRCKGRPVCGQAEFPASEGLDYIETVTRSFRFSYFGQGTFDVDANGFTGPTVIARSGRKVGTDGLQFVETQLVDLDLKGSLANGWRIHVTENNRLPSLGTIRPVDPFQEYDFPADSDFRLFFKVSISTDPGSTEPYIVLFNKDPKVQRNVICQIPPVQQVEPYEPPEPIDLYDFNHPDEPPVGQLLGAHNPEYVPPPEKQLPVFLRGDCNADGLVEISDAIRALFYLFLGAPVDCLAACDMNGDSCQGNNALDVTDPVYLLAALFQGGPLPPPPYPYCGTDPCQEISDPGCLSYPQEACFLGLAARER